MVLLLALSGIVGCMPRREAPAADGPSSGRRVRLSDGTGETIGGLTLRGRSVAVSDARGVPLVRARQLPERIEVRDRTGELQLVMRPAAADAGMAGATEVVIEDPAGTQLGRLTLNHERLALYDSAGQQRGEAVRTGAPGAADELAVYGAPGTDLARLVRSEGSRRIELLDGQGVRVMELEGASVPTWVAAVLALEPVASIAEGTGESERALARAAFQAGAILYVRRAELGPEAEPEGSGSGAVDRD